MKSKIFCVERRQRRIKKPFNIVGGDERHGRPSSLIMPSRKKAQGKARKAKQAAKARNNPTQDNGACNHIGERNWSDDDYDAAFSLLSEYNDKYNKLVREYNDKYNELVREYNDKYNELVRGNDEILTNEFYNLAYDTYDKYYQLNDASKDVLQKMLLAEGTIHCVDAANNKDLTKETNVAGTVVHLVLIITIEIRDKYNGASNQNINREIQAALNDLWNCSRQTIRFFHRRNSCDCLQELYYKLKETTNKTSLCHNCEEVVEIRQLSRCEYCNVVQYCSYDCALAAWPEHKVECERCGYYKPTKPTKTSNDLEEVD
eukprot:scaffold71702_cov25-Cyclotella_meneghiniana.AAC.1